MAIELEFKELHSLSNIIQPSSNLKPKNTKNIYNENRISISEYNDLIPFTKNMVTIDGLPYNKANYFNANYILGYSKEIDFIATKAPINASIDDFWKVIVRNKVPCVVGKVYILIIFINFIKFISIFIMIINLVT